MKKHIFKIRIHHIYVVIRNVLALKIANNMGEDILILTINSKLLIMHLDVYDTSGAEE